MQIRKTLSLEVDFWGYKCTQLSPQFGILQWHSTDCCTSFPRTSLILENKLHIGSREGIILQWTERQPTTNGKTFSQIPGWSTHKIRWKQCMQFDTATLRPLGKRLGSRARNTSRGGKINHWTEIWNARLFCWTYHSSIPSLHQMPCMPCWAECDHMFIAKLWNPFVKSQEFLASCPILYVWSTTLTYMQSFAVGMPIWSRGDRAKAFSTLIFSAV